MAIETINKPNTVAPGGSYPLGDIKDDDGSGNGTPVNTLVLGDFFQFFSQLLYYNGATPNGLRENVTNGYQYLQALISMISTAAIAQIAAAMTQVNGAWTDTAITAITQVGSLPSTYAGASMSAFMSGVTGRIRYKIIGKTMHVNVFASGTTASAANYLLIQLPSGIAKSGAAQYGSCATADVTASVVSNLTIKAIGGGDYLALTPTFPGGSFAASRQYDTALSFTLEIN